MKEIITIVFVLILWARLSQADEIILENGTVYSGNVLDLTENTVSILVDEDKIVVERKDLQAVFLGEQTPFSSNGYPGLDKGKHIFVPDEQKDVPKK